MTNGETAFEAGEENILSLKISIWKDHYKLEAMPNTNGNRLYQDLEGYSSQLDELLTTSTR